MPINNSAIFRFYGEEITIIPDEVHFLLEEYIYSAHLIIIPEHSCEHTHLYLHRRKNVPNN